MTLEELREAIRLLTTDQREHIEVYREPVRGDELPLGTRVRICDPGMSWFFGKVGQIEAYHQPPRGWAGWYWVRFEDTDYADLPVEQLPKIHREKFEVIE